MLHIASREYAAAALGVSLALALASPSRSLAVGIDVGLLIGARPLSEQGVLGSYNHEGGAKNGVGSGGEYFEHVGFAMAAEYLECNSGSLASPNPMTLRFFNALAPVQVLESVEQSLGKGADAHGPLQHGLLHHGVPAALAEAVDYLVVGQHGSEGRTPVYQRLAPIGQSKVLEQGFALGSVHLGPFGGAALGFPVACCLESFGSARRQVLLEGLDPLRARAPLIKPGIKQLQKHPLRPAVVVRIASLHLAAPIKTKPKAVQLLAVAQNIGLRSGGRMLPSLNRILLSRQSKSIKAHGMQHIKTLMAHKTPHNIRSNVAQGMPHMKTRPRRVGEHIKHIKRLPIRRKICAVHR